MHVNTHFATGVISTLLFTIVLPVKLHPVELLACIFAACVPDGDYILSRWAKNSNHRWLPTHSIFPGLGALAFGILLLVSIDASNAVAWTSAICGVNMIIHVSLDSVDWGANLFLRNRLEGKRILMGGKTDEQITKEMDRSPSKNGFFFKKYYENKTIIFIEISSLILMILLIILTWSETGTPASVLILCTYPAFVAYHLWRVRIADKEAGPL
ncbi:MAG: metal-dependent hydrolase [Promethearchaeota archaeon]